MEHPPAGLWGVEAGLAPLAGGHRNAVFRTVGLQQELVFKSTGRSAAALAWLEPVQACARQSGFAVPAMLKSLRGRLVERGWTCEPLVAGNPFPPQGMSALASALARFHALAKAVPQRPGFLSSQALLVARRGGDVDLGAMPPALVAKCRKAWSVVSDGPAGIVHGDLTPANLLSCPDGRIALLDWDECRHDLLLFDLAQLGQMTAAERQAALAWEVACSWAIEPDYAKRIAARLEPMPALAGARQSL